MICLWLLEALQNQKLTEEELALVASKVREAGEAHQIQASRVEPKEIELLLRSTM